MNDSVINSKPVSLSERFPFKCTGCSACCRHVRQSVPLECLDIFRMAKFFRERDPSIKSTDDFLTRYAEPVFGKMKVSQKVSKKLAPQMA